MFLHFVTMSVCSLTRVKSVDTSVKNVVHKKEIIKLEFDKILF